MNRLHFRIHPARNLYKVILHSTRLGEKRKNMSVKFGADAPIKSYGGSKFPKNNRGDPYQNINFFLKIL